VYRAREAEERYAATQKLRDALNALLEEAQSADEKYAHIEQAEKDKVIAAVKDAEQWLGDGLAKIESSPKFTDPAITCKQMEDRIFSLRIICRPILDKPKPKPVPVEEKKEEKPEEKKEETSEGSTEAAPEEKEGEKMDVEE